jgi:hypothetical protein
MQTDPGDTRFNNYILEHGYLWLKRASLHLSLWDPPFYYPTPNTFAYSDILLGSAPLYWLPRLFGFAPDTSYQIWTFFLLGMDFVAMAALLRVFQFSWIATFPSAYLFAFGNIRVSQIGHPQLLPQFYTPLALIALIRAFQSHKKKDPSKVLLWTLACAAALVGQLYSGFYLGWFAIYGLFILLMICLCIQETRKLILSFVQSHAIAILTVGLLSILALAPMAWHYWQASQNVGMRGFGEVSAMLPRLQSWINMGQESLVYGGLHSFKFLSRIPLQGEHRAGVGIITLILVILGLTRGKKQLYLRISGIFLIILLAGTVYTGRRFFGVEPWELTYSFFPGGKAIRAVVRICLLALIPACFAVAYFFETIKKNRVLWMSLFVVLMIEQLNTTPSFDKIATRKEVSQIAAQIPKDCDSFFYTNYKTQDPEWKLQIDAMWAGIEANHPTINGYSGKFPPGWFLFEITKPEFQTRNEQSLKSWIDQHRLKFDPKCEIKGGS